MFALAFVVTFVLTCVVNIQFYRLGARYQALRDLPHNPFWSVSGIGLWRPIFQRDDDPELTRLRRDSGLLFSAWLASVALTMFAFATDTPHF
ncbi:MAG: hypothetical protein M3P38_03850 [Chloroflexota bacterium]|nr:hypothetical protein [Chloroflexota bacterium]